MSKKQQEDFWETVGKNVRDSISEIKTDFSKVKKEMGAAGNDVKEAAQKTAKTIDQTAGKTAIKAEEIWENFDINDRLYGATGGAKIGVLIGLRAGPKGAAVGAVIGGAAGFAVGDKAVKNFRDWRDKHKNSENEAPKPKSPADGP